MEYQLCNLVISDNTECKRFLNNNLQNQRKNKVTTELTKLTKSSFDNQQMVDSCSTR